eukprot:TRINITY_DN678_c0_g1_i1.p1 TRINITY_DN678_c0_g1~~TRINITY_DN678_c0_g1_i1.p1  ORF type:complete len:166 (+),score=46.20 TRINITY_DN678_c0_g1_i1:333-830(+)
MIQLRENPQRGTTVKDVPADAFIAAYAAHLQRSKWLEVPEWAEYVKTSITKELGPTNTDWYFIRAASIARKIYLRPGTGVGALRVVYGNNKTAGTARNHFQTASGKIIRDIMQQLTKIGVVETVTTENGVQGRRVTPEGRKDLDRIAGTVAASMGDDFNLIDFRL